MPPSFSAISRHFAAAIATTTQRMPLRCFSLLYSHFLRPGFQPFSPLFLRYSRHTALSHFRRFFMMSPYCIYFRRRAFHAMPPPAISAFSRHGCRHYATISAASTPPFRRHCRHAAEFRFEYYSIFIAAFRDADILIFSLRYLRRFRFFFTLRISDISRQLRPLKARD